MTTTETSERSYIYKSMQTKGNDLGEVAYLFATKTSYLNTAHIQKLLYICHKKIMADCFSQMYVQIVFAVKNRQALISPEWEDEVYKYITGIIKNKGQKLLAINGTRNHIHIFINIKPSCCLSDLVREIKKSSNAYINERNLSHFKFEWQNGYGAFTYSISDIGNVIK